MAPLENVEFSIVKLAFIPHPHPLHRRFYMKRRDHPPSSRIAHLQEWITRVLSYEISKTESNLNVTYCEWNILSYDVTLFTVHGDSYDSIMLILGEEEIHWLFYKIVDPHIPFEGSGHLEFKYCTCCLGYQYLKIMETVRDHVNRNRALQCI